MEASIYNGCIDIFYNIFCFPFLINPEKLMYVEDNSRNLQIIPIRIFVVNAFKLIMQFVFLLYYITYLERLPKEVEISEGCEQDGTLYSVC